MKLAQPFYRLPLQFDVERLREEVAALPAAAWARHPNDIKGNTSVRLISVDGGENDDVDGIMRPTPHLDRSPYMRQVLASFGVVWSRSRLLKLAPLAGVPRHSDINYHWFYRVRLHIPLVTHPDVRFHCDESSVHMAAGEAWIFDNWRTHWVDNPVAADRIHLVADTSGSASFWKFVGLGGSLEDQRVAFDPARDAQPLTEQIPMRPVMPPAEVDLLVVDLESELAAPEDGGAGEILRYRGLLDAFRRDWRQLYQLFGETEAGRGEFVKLRDSVRAASQEQSGRLFMKHNRVPAHTVLEGRLLRHMLKMPPAADTAARRAAPGSAPRVRHPLFIVAAPRSGSTLLFETLAASDQICTLGGEAHWLVEGPPELRPGAPGVESNRLEASHVTADIAERIVEAIVAQRQDSHGRTVNPDTSLIFLEKTPKNALRIPFFDRVFPDARFLFLWRDPRENLSSIIEAWRSGNWKTYNGLPGFDGPWSLILPPGWKELNGKPVEEIAAFQWEATNRIALDDLGALPRERWFALSYDELCADAGAAVRRICEFAELDVDAGLEARVGAPLPLSRFTQTPPSLDKWRRNEEAVMRMLPRTETTWQRLRSLG